MRTFLHSLKIMLFSRGLGARHLLCFGRPGAFESTGSVVRLLRARRERPRRRAAESCNEIAQSHQ
jgi:hypothetical protein